MKILMFFLSIASFTWVVTSLLRLPVNRVPWCVLAYFLCHVLFTLASWWTWLRVGQVAATPAYAKNYYAWAGLMMAAAVVVSIRYVCERDPIYGVLLFSTCGALAFVISLFLGHWVVRAFNLKHLTPTIINHFTLAGVMLTCGIATFLSLVVQGGGIEDSIKLSLSLYWLSSAAYDYSYIVGRLNPYLSPSIRHGWFPELAAICCCLWLAFTLNSKQAELSRQALPDVIAAEYEVQS